MRKIAFLILHIFFFETLAIPPLLYGAPYPTDLSEPDPITKLEWRRVAGREDAVYLNIPSSELSDRINIPGEPAPVILAKYNPSTAQGQLAVMRMRLVKGGDLQAQILRITPRNFQHTMGLHYYNFAWLDFDFNNPSCKWSEKYLTYDIPPLSQYGLDLNQVRGMFVKYDAGLTLIDPTDSLRFKLTPVMDQVNRSANYFIARLNTDPCFKRVAFKDFDKGNGLFNDISQWGFFRLVSLAMKDHGAEIAFIVVAKNRQEVTQHTSKSFFRKKVTTTYRYYVYPEWWVATRKVPGMHCEAYFSPNLVNGEERCFVKAVSGHTLPAFETLVYERSESKSGWTGLFVFLGMVAAGVLSGGFAVWSGLANATSLTALQSVLTGAGVGAVAGLIAVGGAQNVNLDTTAKFTPFKYSAYELDPSKDMSGDAKAVAQKTASQWLMPDVDKTPGAVQSFIWQIDWRRVLACGGMDPACTESPIEEIPMTDPRWKQVYDSMFYRPHEVLQKYKYPYE